MHTKYHEPFSKYELKQLYSEFQNSNRSCHKMKNDTFHAQQVIWHPSVVSEPPLHQTLLIIHTYLQDKEVQSIIKIPSNRSIEKFHNWYHTSCGIMHWKMKRPTAGIIWKIHSHCHFHWKYNSYIISSKDGGDWKPFQFV